MTHDITEGAIQAAAAHTDEERRMIETMVSAAVRASMSAAKQEIAPAMSNLGKSGAELSSGLLLGVTRNQPEIASMLGKTAGEAGKAFLHEVGGEAAQQLEGGLKDNGPLAQALTGSVERATAAVVQGATYGLASAMSDCESNDPSRCKDDLVRRLSRSAAMGFTEGVGHKVQMWELILAVGVGAVLAVAANWLIRLLVNKGYFGSRRAFGARLGPVGRRHRRAARG